MQRVVLIVDDTDHLAATLEVALSGLPETEVVPASDGAEALKMLDGGAAVCALVTDLRMPRMDGFELIERVRADPRLAGLPIIAVSGDTDPRTPARARRLGADAFFSKPFSPAGLRQALVRLIGAR
jgi:CheY-like chemotaxis protein